MDHLERPHAVPAAAQRIAAGADRRDEVARRPRQIAFYGSTPSYLLVPEQHGWGGLNGKLNQLSRQQAWADMGALIIDALAVAGTADQVATALKSRFGEVVDRISVYAPYRIDQSQLDAVAAELAD